MDKEVFKRLRGRLPDLSQYIFEAKARHVETVTLEEASVVTEVLSGKDTPNPQREGVSEEAEGVREAMEELKVATDGAEGSQVRWRQAVRESMEQYEAKVRKECERVKPFIQDTIKYL